MHQVAANLQHTCCLVDCIGRSTGEESMHRLLCFLQGHDTLCHFLMLIILPLSWSTP